MVLENGVEIGMDYNTVLALIGTPNQVWSDTMAGMGMERLGVMYDFHYDENLVMRLHDISFRFAEDTSTGITSALPAARGIALGEAMQSVSPRCRPMIRRLKSGPCRGNLRLGRPVRRHGDAFLRCRQLLYARYPNARRPLLQHHFCENR